MTETSFLEIAAPSRIHITLVDLGKGGYRRGGGVGFCIAGFDSIFRFVKSDRIKINRLQDHGYSVAEQNRLELALNRMILERACGGLEIIECLYPGRHAGFGTGTATALACVEAITLFYNLNLSNAEIVHYSGRGATSGIGINTYFEGGFILDAGRAFYSDKITSSDVAAPPRTAPLTLLRLDMPAWPLAIVSFKENRSVSLKTELALFDSILPLDSAEVFATAYHAVFGVTASTAEENFFGFCDAINEIQECIWKRSEILVHGNDIVDVMQSLRTCGANAVGMSSVGPSIYCFASDMAVFMQNAMRSHPYLDIRLAKSSNFGRSVKNG